MSDSELTTESTVYATYIRATAERVWAALTSSEFTTQYFFGHTVESDWRVGSPWRLLKPDGSVNVNGVVREADALKRLVVSWNVAAHPEFSECFVAYDIEPAGDGTVRLTMTESHPTPIPATLLEGGRRGWPMILSGLKTLLETGAPLSLTPPAPPKGN
jgi:uncharacterized protein YndB with AHSA1/START domain